MKRNELVNKHVVKAISVGLSAMMAMSPVSALAAEVTPEPVAPTPTEVPTSIPAVTIAPAVSTVKAAPETSEVSNESQLNGAKQEIGEAKDALGDVKTPILSIPLEKTEEIRVNLAAKDVDSANDKLKAVEDAIDKKLDQSVEGKENLGNEESLVDDKATDDMDKAETALGNYADLDVDDAIEAAQAEIEAAETSVEAKQIADGLNEVAEAARKELETSDAELANAAKDLKQAEEDYEAALGISDDAAEKAQVDLNAAKAKLEAAEAKNNQIKSRVDRIDSLLDSVSAKLGDANDNLGSAIEQAKEELGEAKKDLAQSVEKLKKQTANGLGTAAGDFVEQVGLLGTAIGEFSTAVENAKTTGDKLEGLRKQYDDALENYAKAEKAYNTAKGLFESAVADVDGETDKDKLDTLNSAMDQADKLMQAAQDLKDDYEDQEYEAALQNAIDAEDDTETGRLVVEKYLAKTGEKVTWVDANIDDDGKVLEGAETTYGKTATGFYLVYTENEFGEKKNVRRYGKEVVLDEEGKETLQINAIQSDSTENFFQVGEDNLLIQTEDDTIFVEKADGTKLTILGNEKDGYYYEGEAYEKTSRDDTSKLPTLRYDATILSDVTVKPNDYSWNDEIKGYTFTVNTFGFVLWLNEDGSVKEIKNYYTTGGILFEKEYHYTNKFVDKFEAPQFEQIPQITVDGVAFDILGDDNTGYYYQKGTEKVTIIKKGNDFVSKNDVKYVAGGDKNTTFTMGNGTDYSSDTYATVFGGLEADYETKKGLLGQAAKKYDDANDKYQTLQQRLTDRNNAADEKERTDLEAGELLIKTDLSKLPVDIGDVISIEKILSMDETSQGAAKQLIDDMLKGKLNLKDISALTKVLDSMGVDDAGTVAKAIVIANTPARLQPTVTSFQKEYADAWYAAWKAKLDVVSKGFALVEQAGATASAGFTLVVEGGKEVVAVSEVTLDALEVALRAATIGGMELGSDVLTVAQKIVDDMDKYVEKLQNEVNNAADQIREAQDALDAIKLTNPKAEELAKAEQALKDAKARFASLVLEQNKAKAELEKAEKLAEEAEELAKKLADEEAAKNQPTGGTNGSSTGGTTGGSSSGTAGGAAAIQNATVITDEDMELFAQAVADQVVLGARSTRNASAVKTTEGAGEAKEEIKGAGVGEEEIVTPGVEEEEVVTIEDEETALAAALPTAEERAKMSWWWLLIVLICGATGYTWYRNHQKKIEGEDLEG